jgi:hypothetical protein
MSNVLKFPKPETEVQKPNLAQVIAAIPEKSGKVKGALAVVWMIVRLPVFLIMYWLRLPITWLCSTVSVLTLFGFLFAWYAFPEKTTMVWGLAGMSFATFLIVWTYDLILMALSPQEMMKTL